MKRLFGLCILMLTLVFGVNFSAYAVDYPFSVTTTSISSGGTFTFKISASGTFYVDCGTGGTLSGTGVSGTTITKSNTSQYTYTCTYSGTAGAKTIQFGGSATGYVTNDTAAILFSSPALISSLSGNLASVFPQLGTSTSQLPKFWNTFKGSVNLQTIPVTLFSGITRGTRGMFYGLFDGCTGLTDIPQGLFNGITIAGQYMFNFTFRGCTSLVSTPLLFNTTSISCAGQEGVFKGLFMNCTSLQNVPTNLFAGVTDGTAWQFERLFMGCTGLTSIPPTLFSNVTSLGEGTFSETFSGCTNLSGYIPSTLFSGLLSQSTPPTAGYLMSNAFYNTALDTSCPSGTQRYYTAYDSYWSPKVSCISLNTVDLVWHDGDSTITGPSFCAVGSTFIPPTPAARVGYIFKGWRVKERCGIPGLDASIAPTYNFFANNQTWNGTQSGMGGMNGCEYGITTENTWAVEFSYGIVWGRANCNYTSGTANTAGTPTLGNIGTACWCQATGFKTSGDNCPSGPQCTTTASSWWVFQGETTFEEQCVPHCAEYCVSAIQTNAAFRTAIFGVAGQ